MPISGKKLIQELIRRGWVVQSQRGSHVKLFKAGRIVIVPFHGNQDLGIGLIKKIEKQSGEKIL